jgi:hypothetical protein
MLNSSLEQARTADLHEHAARAYCNLVSSAVVQRRHADAQTGLATGLEYCADRALDSWTLYLQGWEAQLVLDQGDLSAAEQRAETVLGHVALAPVGQIQPYRGGQSAGKIWSHDWEEPLARATELAAHTCGLQRVAPATASRCEIAWIAGDIQTVHRTAAQAWQLAGAHRGGSRRCDLEQAGSALPARCGSGSRFRSRGPRLGEVAGTNRDRLPMIARRVRHRI